MTALGVITALAVSVVVGVGATVGAQDGSSSVSSAEQQLAERFVPVLMLKEQSEPCDPDGEPYIPMPVEIVVGNPQIALRQLSRDDPVVLRGPTSADIADLGGGFFLDFPGNSLSPGCLYEQDFDTFSSDLQPTVYAHVVQQPDEPGLVFLQYWFYWYYNDWNNKHESDWEGITLVFEATSVEGALAGEPIAVGYSQHEGGERADWDDPKLSKEGDHPVVYPSAGSHASYFGSALYLGRSASEGFGCDVTDGPSQRVAPAVVVLPDAVDDPADPLAWLSYGGRWGERQSGAFNGPTGPATKARWSEPAPWFEELRPSSVVIPAGDSVADNVIHVFCGAVERGSHTLITFTTSPTKIIVAVLILALLVRFLVGRTDWDEVPLRPIDRRRRAGQILRAAVRTYRSSPRVFILFGLAFIPAAIVTGVLAKLIEMVPFVSSITSLAGRASGTSIVLAALVGSIANIAAIVVVNAAVATYLESDRRGVAAGIDALRSTWDRRRALTGGFVRSFAVVFVLLATVVGAPWGIWQLVRYQFVPQTIVLEGATGASSLDRSTRLVRGRWLHTAIFVAVLNGAVGALALVIGLLLLIVASGIPLWAFSGMVTLVYALVVPMVSIAMTLLYGDARAQHTARDAPDADELVPASVS